MILITHILVNVPTQLNGKVSIKFSIPSIIIINNIYIQISINLHTCESTDEKTICFLKECIDKK